MRLDSIISTLTERCRKWDLQERQRRRKKWDDELPESINRKSGGEPKLAAAYD
jgi:hypothetical protein